MPTVRATEDFTASLGYGEILIAHEGDEFDADRAVWLVSSGCPVEVVDADPAPSAVKRGRAKVSTADPEPAPEA